jgi:hypothetical protein
MSVARRFKECRRSQEQKRCVLQRYVRNVGKLHGVDVASILRKRWKVYLRIGAVLVPDKFPDNLRTI